MMKSTPSHPRERRDPEATRRALLAAAAALFAEHGYDGVPIENVAAVAGVNKALISYHFRGKRGLYRAVLESAFAEMAERLDAIEREAPSAREALHRVLAAFDALRRERADFPLLFLREVLASGVDPAVLPHLVRLIGISRRIVERGVREGSFRRVDPVLFHMTLVGSLAFFFATDPARRRAAEQGALPVRMPSAESFLAYVEELTLRGLAPDTPARRAKGARS